MTVLFVFTFGIVFIVAATLLGLAWVNGDRFSSGNKLTEQARAYVYRAYTCQGCGSGKETGESCSYCLRPRADSVKPGAPKILPKW